MTTENGFPLPSVMAKRINSLQYRAEFLRGRIEARGDDHVTAGGDRGELEALEWAISVCEEEHLHAIRLARTILRAAGVTDEAKQDSLIESGHPR